MLTSGSTGSPTIRVSPTDAVADIVAAAAEGTTFLLSAGVYKNLSITPKNRQTFIGDEGAVLDGSSPIGGWTYANGVWSAKGFPAPAYSHGPSRDGLAQYVEDLVVNDHPYLRVGSLADLEPGRFYVANGTVYMADDPTGKTTEVLHTTVAFNGGTSAGVTIQNLTIKKYASMAQHGAIEAETTTGWTVKNVSAVLNHGAGLAAGSNMTVEGGNYSLNGQVGIHGQDLTGLTLSGISAKFNNYAGFEEGWDAGGVKILTSTNVTVKNSEIAGNAGFGLWFDWDNKGVMLSNNWLHNNDRAGLFYEASYDAQITGNNIGHNALAETSGGFWRSEAVLASSAHVAFTGNQLVAATQNGLAVLENKRADGVYGAHVNGDINVSNNTFIMLGAGANGVASDGSAPQGAMTWDRDTYVAPTAEGLSFSWDNRWMWSKDLAALPIEHNGTFYFGTSPIKEVNGFLTPLAPVVASGATFATSTLGAGADTLVFKISQDAYEGAAHYNLLVDGEVVSATELLAVALHSSGVADIVTVKGNWSPGVHTVLVQFLNDAWGGNAGADRNLYLEGVAFKDDAAASAVTLAGSSAALMSTGTKDLAFSVTPPAVPASTSVSFGAGPDTLSFKTSQDAYQGDAKYNLLVDGMRVNPMALTAVALHGSGATDTVLVKGNWAVGAHSIAIEFLNDAYDGSAAMDRNLYVEGVSFKDDAAAAAVTLVGSSVALMATGSKGLAFTVAPPPAPAASAITLGTGLDALTFKLSQDAYLGSAKYNLLVDGVKVNPIELTAVALHGSGVADTVTVKGNWGTGVHNVGVQFLNDAYGGSSTTDRNLYVESAAFKDDAATASVTLAGSTAALMSEETKALSFMVLPTPASVTLGTGPDTLSIRISQDAYQGSAQYNVLVDGAKMNASPLTAVSAHGSGMSDTVTVKGDWAAGKHLVGVQFLNDAYGGSAATDCNLYVDGILFKDDVASTAVSLPGSTLALMASGTQTMSFSDGGHAVSTDHLFG